MHNIVYLIGRLNGELVEKDGKVEIPVAVQRSYKNEAGEYEVDLVPCVLWNGIAKHTQEYCQEGDLVGIKGSIEAMDGKMVVVVNKITFLSSKRPEEN